MQASPSLPTIQLNSRARSVLAAVFALFLVLSFGASHASAAVHAKSRSHGVRAHKNAATHRNKKHHKPSPKPSGNKQTTPGSTSAGTNSAQPTTNAVTGSVPSTPGVSAASTDTVSGSTSGTVLFDGSAITSWWLNQSASPTRVQLVPDPSGTAGTAQQFTTYNTDVAPLTPTTNPRSQLVTPLMFKPGQTYWESFEVYIPTNYTFTKSGWVSLESAVYGYPYNGTPPATLSLENGSFRFQRDQYAPNPWQIAWSTPVVRGQWYRFTWHFLFAAKGWIELYVNDVQQSLKSGSSTVKQLPISLLDPTDSKGPWMSQEQLYYQLGLYPSASVYFKNYKVATTQAAAES